jgi:peptidoglycan-associated lipoprotein
MNRILIQLAAFITLTVALAGCSSGVRLSDVPVENRTVNSQGSAGDGSGAVGREVAAVKIDASQLAKAGPVGVATVIYFDYDSFVIKPEFLSVIQEHARFLSSNPTGKIVVEGNTDERGGREYNLALGQKRAEAVRRALGLLGIADSQVEAVSFGEEKPAVAGSDEEAYAKNRRAEINYR